MDLRIPGLLLTGTDALNNQTMFMHDAFGRLLTTTNLLNRTTTLTDDAAGMWRPARMPLDVVSSPLPSN